MASHQATPRPLVRCGLWRAVCLIGMFSPLLPLGITRADPSLSQCQRWQHSRGTEFILLGNAIGAASYLTKVKRFAESPPEKPELLYAPTDLMRACEGWR